MSDTSPDNCMMPCDLDGFLTGIAVGPEPVSSEEWLSAIWGGEEPEFESEQQKTTILDTIMGRYNEIAGIMASDPDSFDPILEQWPDGVLVVTDWAAGFIDAIKLRHKAWGQLLTHRRAKLLVEPLIILGDDEDFFERPTPEAERQFYASKPRVIQTCVIGTNDFWRAGRLVRSRIHGGGILVRDDKLWLPPTHASDVAELLLPREHATSPSGSYVGLVSYG